MIKMNLLENGSDSLKSAYIKMDILPELEEGLNHYLKDIIIFLNHGIEILFKLVLKNKEEGLIFSNQKKYLEAKVEMVRQGKSNVFEVNPYLKTVSLTDSIKIAKLEGLEIKEEFDAVLTYLNKIRNQFMHYEIELTDTEMLKLLVKLQLCYDLSMDFFKLHIENLEDYIDDARFEAIIDDKSDLMAESHAESMFEDYLESMRDIEY